MKRWITAVAGLTFAIGAQARIVDVSGDLDVGPERDYMQGLLCDDPMIFFRMIELGADGNGANSPIMQKYAALIEKKISKGSCIEVPISSAWVIGIKTAKIAGKNKTESLYSLAKVEVQGRFGYTLPDYVGQTGKMIIQSGRQYNKKTGRAIYQ